MAAPPIACTLTEPEMRERRAGLLRRVREGVLEVRQLGSEPALAGGPPGSAGGGAGSGDGSGGSGEGRSGSGAGFELRLAGDEATVADVLELVRLESRCCAFLRFRVTLEPDGGPLLLEVTGPRGGADLLADELAPRVR